MIKATNLNKVFRTWVKEPGLRGSLRSFVRRSAVKRAAVRGFDLDIGQGELVGLIGPNGAGKTTLMKMMTGIIVPTDGELSVLGYRPWERARLFRKRIALVMGQKSQLWWDIPAMDSFLLLQKYYEIPVEKFRQRLDELTTVLQVGDQLNVHLRKLSLGERMKMELMGSLLHEPDVLFLDEPTIGLDLVSQNNIRQFLGDYQRAHDTTIILTSHYMADVHALCERIVLILDGEKQFDGAIDDFEGMLGREKFVAFRFANAVDRQDEIWRELDPVWTDDGLRVELKIPEDRLREITVGILQRFPVADFRTDKLPLERVMTDLMVVGKSP